jgi:hypothetical protein
VFSILMVETFARVAHSWRMDVWCALVELARLGGDWNMPLAAPFGAPYPMLSGARGCV